MLDAISGMLSTHDIEFLSAYIFLSAGARFCVCEIILIPISFTFFINSSSGNCVLYPGIDSILSTVPPVNPSPLPDILATFTPNELISGNSIIDTLSPTPPVECLSTIIPSIFDKSSISPEFAISIVRFVLSLSVIPFIYIAIISAAA